MKNYVGFVNDHSGSMDRLAKAAMNDYNANITVTKEAASKEMLDTVVSVVGVGIGKGGVQRQVVISNPHVLKPVGEWPTPGGTPLRDGVGSMIELFESLPDAQWPDVSFLIITTTDGQEQHSKVWSHERLAAKIKALQDTGRWTFVFRIPKGGRRYLNGWNIPMDNIQEWDTTEAGMAESTAMTKQAMNNFYATRTAGARSSTSFYANATSIDVSALVEVDPRELSLYLVPDDKMGIEIRDFILTKRMQYLKGSAFYQLTKTEARVQHTKLIAIRDRSNGKVYAGEDARKMIGLPTDRNARLHPGDHGNYDIFIQSESVNRKLVAGTGVLYWAAIGKPFTEADLAYLNRKPKDDVVQLPAVTPTSRPTKSPIPVTPKAIQPMIGGRPVQFFATRDEARATGKPAKDNGRYAKPGERWYVYL